MKTSLLIKTLLCLVFAAQTAFAQPNKRERVEAARASFFTERMQLSPEQAQKFWPLYNEYENKRKELKRKSHSLRDEEKEKLSDKEARESIYDMMDYRQKQLDLEKAYVDKFLNVISARQLATMYRSEKEFMRMLIKRMDRRGPGKKQ